MRPRRARRPLDGEPVRPIDARARRTSIFLLDAVIAPAFPEQHRALRRALSAGVLARRSGRRQAGRPDAPAARRVPDVLGHRQPQRLVGAVADGDGRQPARRRDRARRSASRSDSARGCSPPRCPTLCGAWRSCRCCSTRSSARRCGHARCAGGGAEGARRARPAVARRNGSSSSSSSAWSRSWASAATARARLDGGRVPRPRRRCSRPASSRSTTSPSEGDVLATFIWFAVLFTLSSQLNELGFMGFLGGGSPDALGGLAAPTAGLVARRRLRRAALPVREPDGAPAGALRRVPRRRRQARRDRPRRSRSSCCSRRTTSRRSRRRDRARTCCSRAAAICRRATCTGSAPSRRRSASSIYAGRRHAVAEAACVTRCEATVQRRQAATRVHRVSADSQRGLHVIVISHRGVVVSCLALLPPRGARGARSTARPQAKAALPTVVVLATGGTIAGAAGTNVQAGYTSGQVGVEQLLAAVPAGQEARQPARRADLQHRLAGHERRGLAQAGPPRQRAGRDARRRRAS